MGWMIKGWIVYIQPSNSSNKTKTISSMNEEADKGTFYWCFISVNRIHNFIDH